MSNNHIPTVPTPSGTDPVLLSWCRHLLEYSPSTFTEFMSQQDRNNAYCDDINNKRQIHAKQIIHYCHGCWQSDGDIETCMTALFRRLQINPKRAWLTQGNLDDIFKEGKPPNDWNLTRSFNLQTPGPLHMPYITGIRHNGTTHFVVYYICPDFWTILDPLYAQAEFSPDLTQQLHSALTAHYENKGIQTPTLPPYLPAHRIGIQHDAPLSPWSCGTWAILTALHLLLGDYRPGQIPPNALTNQMMLNLHQALLKWLLLGTPPDIYNQSILNNNIATRAQVPIPTNMLPPCSLHTAAELPPHSPTSHIHNHYRTNRRQLGPPPTDPSEQFIPPRLLKPLDTKKNTTGKLTTHSSADTTNGGASININKHGGQRALPAEQVTTARAHSSPYNLISSEDSGSETDSQEHTSSASRNLLPPPPSTQPAEETTPNTQRKPPPEKPVQHTNSTEPTEVQGQQQCDMPHPPTRTKPHKRNPPGRHNIMKHPPPEPRNNGLQKQRNTLAKRRETMRRKLLTKNRQHPLSKYWPAIVPQSLPLNPHPPSPPKELPPHNLHSIGWRPSTRTSFQDDIPTDKPHTPLHSPTQTCTHATRHAPHNTHRPGDSQEREIEPDKTPHAISQPPKATSPLQKREGSQAKDNESNTTHKQSDWAHCSPTILKLATQNVQKTGKDSPSGMDIKTLISTESPDVLFITETPYDKDCSPLCSMLRNQGYYIHFRPTKDPVLQAGTLAEARIPSANAGTNGGCMLAFKKKQNWSHAVSPAPLPPGFPPVTACALEITLTRRRKCLLLCCYLPQDDELHEETCLLLTENIRTHFPDHAVILGGDLQGSWTGKGRKSDNIRTSLLYSRFDGPATPTYIPPHQPKLESCIDHFAHLADNPWIKQAQDTYVHTPAFLDHRAVLTSIELPIAPAAAHNTTRPTQLTPELNAPTVKLKFPIPKPELETWRCAVRTTVEARCIELKSQISSLLETTGPALPQTPPVAKDPSMREQVIHLAQNLHCLLTEGFEIAKATLPTHHTSTRTRYKSGETFWPRTIRHDLSTLRNRAKALRKLAKIESASPQPREELADELEPDTEMRDYLRSVLSDPPDLRTTLDTPLRDTDTLILVDNVPTEAEPDPDDSKNAIQTCYQAHRLATRRTIRHARRLRSRKYGQSLLRLFTKKPKAALKAILKAADRNPLENDDPTPTDLSIISDHLHGGVTTDPATVRNVIEDLQRQALSLRTRLLTQMLHSPGTEPSPPPHNRRRRLWLDTSPRMFSKKL